MTITSTLTSSGQPLTITADGTYYLDVGGPLRTLGQFNSIHMVGTFGGGTCTLYTTPDGSETYKVAIPAGTATADKVINVLSKSRGYILILSGAVAPSIKIWCL